MSVSGMSMSDIKPEERESQKKENVYYPFPKLNLIMPEEYLKGKDANVEISRLKDINMKYVVMKNFLDKRKEKTKKKIEELNESILTVRGIEKKQKLAKENMNEYKKALELFMPLEETLYIKGEMSITDTIYIWLGANVMVELKFGEALDLLESHLERAHNMYRQLVEETEYMCKQVEIANANLAAVVIHLQKRKRENIKPQA